MSKYRNCTENDKVVVVSTLTFYSYFPLKSILFSPYFIFQKLINTERHSIIEWGKSLKSIILLAKSTKYSWVNSKHILIQFNRIFLYQISQVKIFCNSKKKHMILYPLLVGLWHHCLIIISASPFTWLPMTL